MDLSPWEKRDMKASEVVWSEDVCRAHSRLQDDELV
jgi:hypothetical protein